MNYSEQRYNFEQKVRIFRGLIILFLFFISYNIFSQTINLEQARELALANSRSLARYEMAIRSSILDERSQLYSMLPQLSAGYSASANYLKDWEFVNPIDNIAAGATFSISQVIFRGGKSFIEKAISAIGTESVKLEAREAYFTVLDSIDNAYYAVLEAKATLEDRETSLKASVLGLSIAEIRYSSGMITQGDYLEALSGKETSENSFNQARRDLTSRMSRFKTLTGITDNVELEQIVFDEYENLILHLAGISDEQADALFENFWEIITASNLSLAKAALDNKAAEKRFTLSKRDYLPTIRATVFSTGLSFLPSFKAASTGGISITGDIPIDFWVLKNRNEQSRISYERSLLAYEDIEISIEQNLQAALFNLFSQAGTVLSSRRSLEYTERRFEFVMQRYRLLQASVSELNDATSAFITSHNRLNSASYSFLQGLSTLRSMCALDDEEKLLELLLR